MNGGLAIVNINGKDYPLIVYSVSPSRILAGQYALVLSGDKWQVEGYTIPHTVQFHNPVVSVGEQVNILIDNNEFPLIVTGFDQTGIRSSNYSINTDGLLWQVLNYPIQHTVRFPVNLTFTNVPEADEKILLELDYPSLLKTCSTNTYVASICLNDSFWKEKLIHDVNSLIIRYKPVNITYRQQYVDLRKKIPIYSIRRLDQMMVALLRGEKLQTDSKRYIYSHADIPFFIWMEEHGIPIDSSYTIHTSDLEVLKWFEQKGIPISWMMANSAVIDERIDTLEWLKEKNILPEEKTVDQHIQYRNKSHSLDVLDWLSRNGIFPTSDGLEWAANNGDRAVLEWAVSLGIPMTKGILNNALAAKRFDLARWIMSLGVRPDQDSAKWVLENDELLREFVEGGILPYPKDLDILVNSGNIPALDYLASKDILPSKRAVANADRIDVLEWLLAHNALPNDTKVPFWANDVGPVDKAVRRNRYDILEWFFAHKYYPTEGVTKSQYLNPKMRQWLTDHGIRT